MILGYDPLPTFSSSERTFTPSVPPSFMSSTRAPYVLHSRKYTPPCFPIAGHKSECQADHATASLPTPRPSLDLSGDLRSLPHASDPTDPGIVALPTLPTPHPSLDSSSAVRPLSYNQVLSKLKPFLDGTAGEKEISIEGVSSEVIDELMKKSRASELPGWENLRCVWFV